MRRIAVYLVLFCLLLLLAGGYLAVRSGVLAHRIGNYLKVSLERNLGRPVQIGEVIVNPFPLFIEIKDLRLGTEEEKILNLYSRRVRAWLGYEDLLRKRLRIRRLELYSPEVSLSEVAGIPLITGQTTIESSGWKVSVDRLKVHDASIVVRYRGVKASLRDLSAEFITKEGRLKFHFLGEMVPRKGGFQGSFDGEVVTKGKDLDIQKLRIVSGRNRVALEGEINRLTEEGILDLRLKGRVAVQELLKWLGEREPIRGVAFFKGSLEGTLSSPLLKLKAKMGRGHLYGVDVDSVICQIVYKEKKLQFLNGMVKTYNGKAKVEVSLNLPKVTWYELRIIAQDLDSPPLLSLIKWNPGFPPGKVSGVMTSEGRRLKPKGWFVFKSGGSPHERKLPEMLREARGFFFLRDGMLILSRLKVRTEGMILQGGGVLNLKQKRAFFEGEGEIDALAPLFNTEDIEGRGKVKRLVVYGDSTDPEIVLNIDLNSLNLRGMILEDVTADLLYRDTKLYIRHIQGEGEKERIRLSGIIETGSREFLIFKNPVLHLSVSARGIPLKILSEMVSWKYLERTAGSISYSGSVEGALESPLLKGKLEAEDLTVQGFTIDNLSGEISYKGDDLQARMIVRRGESMVEGDLRLVNRELSSDIHKFILACSDLPLRCPFQIRLKGTGHIKGRLREPLFRASLQTSLGLPSGRWYPLGEIAGDFGPAGGSIKGEVLNRRISIRGGYQRGDRFEWYLNLFFRHDNYDDLLSAYRDSLPEDFLLVVAGEIKMKGNSEGLSAEARFDTLQSSLYERGFSNSGPVLLRYTNKRLEVVQLRLLSGTGEVNVHGYLIPGERVDLTLYGGTYLSPFIPFVRGIEQLDGYSEFVFSITGRWNDPVLSGGISLRNTTLKFEGVRERFTGVSGYAYVDENTVTLDTLTGEFSRGRFRIRGSSRLKGTTLEDYYLEGVFQEVMLKPLEGMNLLLSGNLVLSSTEEGPLLTAEVNLQRARFTRDIDWRQLLIGRSPSHMSAKRATLKDLYLSVKIVGQRDILIENNILRAPAKVDILITGPLSRPSIFGRVELTGGKIFFRNNQFNVIRASADFTDPEEINPYLEIVADTTVKGYKITLMLDGYMKEFNLALLSDPPLDEVDILSLLTVGSLSEGVKGLEGGITAYEATMFITGKLQETLQKRLKSLTGFDRIEIEPTVSETTGTIGPKVTLFKRLLSDRLYLTYTTTVGAENEQFLKIEFLLNDRVSLVGERDELGSIGGDIKFRLEFR